MPQLFRVRNLRKLLGEYRDTHIARLDALHDAQLQHFHNLFHRRTKLERSLDVVARSWGVHVRERCVAGDAEELHLLCFQCRAAVWIATKKSS